MGSLDDHGFVSTFGNNPDQFPSFFFFQMDFVFFVRHPSILSLPYNLNEYLSCFSIPPNPNCLSFSVIFMK